MDSKLPLLYGLPKIHKYGVPLRPITCSRVDLSKFFLNRYILQTVQPIIGKTSI